MSGYTCFSYDGYTCAFMDGIHSHVAFEYHIPICIGYSYFDSSSVVSLYLFAIPHRKINRNICIQRSVSLTQVLARWLVRDALGLRQTASKLLGGSARMVTPRKNSVGRCVDKWSFVEWLQPWCTWKTLTEGKKTRRWRYFGVACRPEEGESQRSFQ